MITFELYDILERKRAVGQALSLPPQWTLLAVLEYDAKLAKIIPSIDSVSVNGIRLDDWRHYCPSDNDRIVMEVTPRYGLSAWAIIQIVVAVVSVVATIVSFFNRPKNPKEQRGPQPSSTYNFEGLQDTIAPGDVIPAVYGEHRKGGQLLMYYLTMLPNDAGLAMNMLLSMGEGQVHAIDDVEINELSISSAGSVTVDVRLGLSSQSIITGFEQIKNTFHDGREISDEVINSQDPQQSAVVYRTSAFDVQELEAFVAALRGLTCIGLNKGTHYPQWTRYRISFRDAAYGTNAASSDLGWIFYGSRTINGQYERAYWDHAKITFPYASRWDVQFLWDTAQCNPRNANPGTFTYQIWLQDVTEVRGACGPYSGEALLGITAAPNRIIYGGRPNVTARVQGLIVDIYSTPSAVATKTFTRNPAWPVLDYLTNSRYGAGAHFSRSEMDIQSFIDFATLSESLTNICPPKGCFPEPQSMQSVALIGSEMLGDGGGSWSHVTPVGTGEVIMVGRVGGTFNDSKYLYRCENGACNSVSVQAASGTLDNTLRLGISDRHTFYGEHQLSAFRLFHYDEGAQVDVIMSGQGFATGAGFSDGGFTVSGNYAYGGAVDTTSEDFMVKIGAFDGRLLNRLAIGSGTAVRAVHANGTFLYALTEAGSGGDYLVKIQPDDFYIVDRFFLSGGGYKALYAQENDLVYLARQRITGNAIQLEYVYARGPSTVWSAHHISSIQCQRTRNITNTRFVLNAAQLGSQLYFYYGEGSSFDSGPIDKIGPLICTTV